MVHVGFVSLSSTGHQTDVRQLQQPCDLAAAAGAAELPLPCARGTERVPIGTGRGAAGHPLGAAVLSSWGPWRSTAAKTTQRNNKTLQINHRPTAQRAMHASRLRGGGEPRGTDEGTHSGNSWGFFSVSWEKKKKKTHHFPFSGICEVVCGRAEPSVFSLGCFNPQFSFAPVFLRPSSLSRILPNSRCCKKEKEIKIHKTEVKNRQQNKMK